LIPKNVEIKIYINIIVSDVVYWCETWLVILRMCESRVLRKISVAKREEVTEDWRKLNDKEIHDFYSMPNYIMVTN
jgi:hypothetical protein